LSDVIEYYAKSSDGKYTETLFSHLCNTLEFAKKQIKSYGIYNKQLIRAIKIASAFHDIGKADYRFQQYLINNEPRVYHPLLGLPVVWSIAQSLENSLRSLVTLSVASHHTSLHQDLYKEANTQQALEVAEKHHFENIVLRLAHSIGIRSVDPSDFYDVSCVKTLLNAKYDFMPSSVEEGVKLRDYFVLIQGILNYSDWLASGADGKDSTTSISGFNKKDFVSKPYSYQLDARKVDGNVFITLPTGSGKTETALYWIAGNIFSKTDPDNIHKVFYTLPTTTTINAMYNRLTDKGRYGLDDDIVSEYFSNVDLYLNLEGSNPKRANMYLYKNFFFPINVTTPDQLLLAMMNHGRYTLKSFMMRKSLVIIDEIHAYDAETFGLIKSLIRHLYNHCDSRFCIMSATFPTVLREELSFLDAKELIPKDTLRAEYSKRRRTRLEFHDSYIYKNLEAVITSYLNGNRVLVVTNTVRRAQNIFLTLRRLMNEYKYPDEHLMLIHSRFTFRDRRQLESRIFSYPRIVVATQVIEVSLDIDYDEMFTETCYPDSLVQRAGRVNRNGKLGNSGQGLVNLYLPEGWNLNRDVASLPYDPELLSSSISLLREHSQSLISELDYLDLTNRFYDQYWNRSEEAEERFEEIWNQVHYIYRANLSEEGMIELLRTRSGIMTINAYSRRHWDEILNLDRQLNLAATTTEQKYAIQRQIRMYSINVPVVRSAVFIRRKGYGDLIDYIVVEADYDKQLGLLVDNNI
jgi:CRISPR-associated endonuclease/helicase Cas3